MPLGSKQNVHHPGPLKQQNKAHKHGKHRSNRAVEMSNKGKVDIKLITKKARKDLNKQERRNQALQLRKKKREEAFAKQRSLGRQSSPPFLVAIIPLSLTEDPYALLHTLKTCDEEAVVTLSSQGSTHISSFRFKQRFEFFIPKPSDLYAALDAAKVADTLLFLHPLNQSQADCSEQLLSILFAHGLPSTIHVVQGLENVPVKKKSEVKKNLMKSLECRFPEEKLNFIDKPQDALLIFRQIGSQKKRSITLREKRAHLFAESVGFDDEEPSGTLQVSGYIRGQPFNVNNLIHIPGWGDFQMSQIDSPTDPHPLVCKGRHFAKERSNSMAVDEESSVMDEVKILEKADVTLRESLVSENVPDPMNAEQTWPTKEEIAQAEAAFYESGKVIKKVPKGTSEYMAAWIVDSDDDAGDEDDDDEGEEEGDDQSLPKAMEEEISEKEECESELENDTDAVTEESQHGDIANYDEENCLNMDEEKALLQKFRDERSEELFPDEVETPLDTPAKVRFARYRGLKSFLTSPWDPKENLPADYARIFQFENFNRTRKKMLSEERKGAQPGWYVTLHIIGVPKALFESYNKDHPLIIYNILPHEQKMSVLNLAVRRHQSCKDPIKSKERLIFHVGYRRFATCPIFSSHTTANKHKYERFLRSNSAAVATIYGPIIFPPATVIIMKEQDNGCHQLIATGSVLSVDPDRIVVKRIVLSGHPFKITKRAAVVRYMFFNKDDIFWFKPVELRTKYGRKGHIKDSLGTHGHMKCIFDKQLKSQDTVLMNLYKRVFPKWTYDTQIQNPIQPYDMPPTDQEME